MDTNEELAKHQEVDLATSFGEPPRPTVCDLCWGRNDNESWPCAWSVALTVVEAAEALNKLHIKRDQMIDLDTWESDAGPPVWKRLQKAEAKLAARLDVWHRPTNREKP